MRRSHVVFYRTNPNNPKAAARIVQKARELFEPICRAGDIHFHAATIPPPTRAVQGNEFQVMLNFIFPNQESYEWYMAHENHRAFVRFVLFGLRLKGDEEVGAQNRFFAHVLYSSPSDPPKEWEKDPDIAEDFVVWGGERVFDA